MNKGEFVKMIHEMMERYRNIGILQSVKRNKHMNDYKGEPVSQETLDAIMVDFVNYIAATQGMDYALYTKDLKTLNIPKENNEDIVI